VIWKDSPAVVRARIHPGASLRFAPAHLESSQADVAQLVEQSIRNRQVIGSSPIVGSILSTAYSSVHHDLRHKQFFSSSRFIASVHSPCCSIMG
jgi:hypothetical protein